MPRYTIQGPDGKTYTVEGPAGATADQLGAFVAGQQSRPPEPQYDPSETGLPFRPFGVDTGLTMPQGVSRAFAGMGKSFVDTGRAVGQYMGMVKPGDIDESRRLDAPLLNTGAGLAGNIGGLIAQAAPAAMLAGASIPAAAGIGVAQGALTPTGSKESTLGNMAMGGALGAAGPLAVRGVAAGVGAARALADPLTLAGQQRVAGRMLERFADDPTRIAGAAAASVGPTRTGSVPTLAESTGDAGIARLQDALRSMDPEIAGTIEAQLAQNNAARVERLRELAGTRDGAVAQRQAQTGPLYRQAFANQIDESLAPKGSELMQSPAIAQAAGQARTNALNRGDALGANGSVYGLHQSKLALDAAIAQAESQTGKAAGDANIAGLRAARDRLVGFIEEASPEYNAARQAYAQLSRPVNQADIGEQLLKSTSNTTNLPNAVGDAGVPRIQTDAFLRQIRNGDKTVKQATGRSLGGIEDVLDPGQLNLVNKIAQEVDRTAAVGSAGAGPGSATAKRMASQNLLRQIAGPTGLPESWVESALLTNLMRPVQFAYGTAEPAIQRTIARGLLDPVYADELLTLASRSGRPVNLPNGLGLLGTLGNAAVPAAGLLGSNR